VPLLLRQALLLCWQDRVHEMQKLPRRGILVNAGGARMLSNLVVLLKVRLCERGLTGAAAHEAHSPRGCSARARHSVLWQSSQPSSSHAWLQEGFG
jgi:hypothetical protein